MTDVYLRIEALFYIKTEVRVNKNQFILFSPFTSITACDILFSDAIKLWLVIRNV